MNEKNKKVQEDEIDLLELAFLLLSRWKYLLIALLIGALLGGGAAYLKKDTFRSDSMIFVLSNDNNNTTSYSDLQIGSTISKDFVAIAKSKPVLDSVIEKLEEQNGTSLTREEVSRMLSVENMTDTRIIKFSVVSTDAKLACDVCNAVATTMVGQIATIMRSDEPTIVEEAEIALKPVGKGMQKFTAMGAMIAFLLAAMFVIIPFLLDDRIMDDEDVEKYLDTPVLGVIPYDKAQEYSVGQNTGNSKRKRRKRK